MDFNSNQHLAVYSNHPRIVCLACPGSGKSRVLTERIKRLISDGVNPLEIVAITFTVAGSEVFKERLPGIVLGHCGTLHSYMLSLLRTHGPDTLGITKTIAVIDEETREAIIADICHEQGYKGSRTKLDEALAHVPMLEGKRPRTAPELVSAAYHQRLLEHGLVDYDSILAYGLHLIQSITADSHPADRLRPIAHLLMDEQQDSSEMDYKIYEALPAANKFAVGDPCQSIFKFRGGSPEWLLKWTRNKNWLGLLLEDNYRSDVTICASANAMISHSIEHPYMLIVPHSTGYGEVMAKYFDDDTAEAIGLGGKLLNHREHWNECAVLVRTNFLVDQLATTLRGMGIAIRQKNTDAKPVDWLSARQMVEFLASPWNDLLAFNVVKRLRGEPEAKKMRSQAIQEMTCINDLFLHVGWNVTVAAVTEAMARAGIGRESLAVIEKVIADKAISTLSELTLRLADDEIFATEEGDGVYVGTIHSAKGREWDHVFLPAFNQEVIPGAKATGEDIQEARRLAYVAVTRARHTVWLSWAGSRRGYAQAPSGKPATPSQFLAEMGL